MTYSAPITTGVFVLFLHRLRGEADLVDAAVSRLEAVPTLVEAGIANLDPALAHPLIVERGGNAAKGGMRYFRDLASQDVEDEAARERMRTAGQGAAPTSSYSSERLDELVDNAHGSWQLGEERYSRVLREREVLPDDARQLRERGQREFDRLDAEMRALSADATGNPDYVAVLRANDTDHPRTEQAMLDAYTEWTERARQFLVDTGLVTSRTARLRGRAVAGVPAAGPGRGVVHRAAGVQRLAPRPLLRPVPARRRRGGGDPGAAVEQQLGSMPTTSVHEAYPATTGTSSSARRRRRHGCARSTGPRTSTRAGRCTPSA